MKANKALKRLAKIEALISNVTQRYSASAPAVRKVLRDAKAAVARAKEAVSLRLPQVAVDQEDADLVQANLQGSPAASGAKESGACEAAPSGKESRTCEEEGSG